MIIKIILILLLLLLALAGLYVYNNLNYYKKPKKQTQKAGFLEKQIQLPNGTVLNYGEGPNNGLSLMLIHAQTAAWQDYEPVLPELSKHFHIYAIDCHGHGKSSKDPSKYSAEEMGKDFIWFIKNVIKQQTIVSGNSSGGLLAAWLAANSPENVQAIVLEDPPFFSCEANRCEKSFAWIDSFQPMHEYLKQTEQTDYVMYYIKNCHWLKYFGNGREGIINYAQKYREKHPNKKLQFFFLPPSINKTFRFLDYYDPRFGDGFYDCSWLKNFNHAETLAKINCDSVLIHANFKYENDILLAAMDNKDAQKASSLIKNNELIKVNASHVVHSHKPQLFIKIMKDFLGKLQS